jgi:ribosomal-protein-alanine N-acetyltransferase
MIETANLRLVPCEMAHFEAYLRDRQELGNLLGVKIPDGWPHFPEALPMGYKWLKRDPALLGWWTYLFIHRAEQMLIGSGGFKGRANENGMVEIGYEIAPSYRERGFATEAARGMVDYAFSHAHVRVVDAHTLPEKNASGSVLSKVGMRWMGVVHHPEDGEIWHWRLSREEYEAV